MAKNKRLTIDDKKLFLQLRAEGYTINYCSKQIGVCNATGTKLEKLRKSGLLEEEILAAEHPHNTKDIQQLNYMLEMISRCEKELSTRNIEMLSTPQLTIFYNKLITAKQAAEKRLQGKKGPTTEEKDELDLIYEQVAKKEGPPKK